MSKSILYRLFGLGEIPSRVLPDLEQEGIVLLEEGISRSIIFKDFRAPGRRYSRRYSLFIGSLVLTEERFAAFTFFPAFNPIINVALDDQRLMRLRCSLKRNNTLSILFDVSLFHDNWYGSIECRFSTPQARAFIDKLAAKGAVRSEM